MDNFHKPKKKKQASLDGFVTGGTQRSVSGGDLRAFNQYYKPNQPVNNQQVRNKVDKFQGTDGFRPSAQPVIPHPGSENKSTELPPVFNRNHDTEVGKASPAHIVPKKKRKPLLFGRRRSKHAVTPKKKSKLRTGLKVSAVLGAILILVGGGLALKVFLTSRNIFKGGGNSELLNSENVDPTLLNGEGDGRVNILVMGKGGNEQPDGPDLTDTIIVASIDPIAKEAALLSIPRDLWVKSPSGYQSKVNEVYANAKYAVLNNYSYKERTSDAAKEASEKAGIDSIKKTISDSMGVPIHYYAMIDFSGFKKAIDTVGGIDINVTQELAVTEQMRIGGQSYKLDVPAGQQHFDGLRALAFSRSRHTSSKGDFARAERQRAVIMALKDKVLSTGTLANPLKINSLIGEFGDHVTTDFNVNQILRLYDLAKDIPADKIASAGLDGLVMGQTINSLSAQVPKAGLFDFTDIQAYVRNIMQDAFLKKENAKIMILNGTSTAGLATTKSKELKSYGYNIVSVGDAPTEAYTSTVLVDLRNGVNKYTMSYLEKRLGVKATQSLPDSTIDASTADFVIILGAAQ